MQVVTRSITERAAFCQIPTIALSYASHIDTNKVFGGVGGKTVLFGPDALYAV